MPDSLHIKCENPHFTHVWNGDKTFEVRLNDRNYHVGQLIHLDEYSRDTQKFSGRSILIHVKHILQGPVYGIDMNYCIFGFDVLRKEYGNAEHVITVALNRDTYEFLKDRAARLFRTIEETAGEDLDEFRDIMMYHENKRNS